MHIKKVIYNKRIFDNDNIYQSRGKFTWFWQPRIISCWFCFLAFFPRKRSKFQSISLFLTVFTVFTKTVFLNLLVSMTLTLHKRNHILPYRHRKKQAVKQTPFSPGISKYVKVGLHDVVVWCNVFLL